MVIASCLATSTLRVVALAAGWHKTPMWQPPSINSHQVCGTFTSVVVKVARDLV